MIALLDDARSRLNRHVEMLASTIGPRHIGRPAALESTAEYIERQFAECGDSVTRETYLASGVPVHNLVVNRIGSRRPDEILIVGAHYDTIPTTPGADDNASAVAMLIEIARLLAALPTRRTLRLIAFTCEEPPHYNLDAMGSQYHARGCRQRNENVVGMLSLEMVGYYCDEPGSQNLPPAIPRGLRWAFPKRANFLAAVGNPRSAGLLWPFRRGFKRSVSFPLFTIALPERVEEIRRSDNSSFWDQGYRALMITDTSFLRNPHYHMPTDEAETLDFERLAKATLGVAGGVARLVGASLRT